MHISLSEDNVVQGCHCELGLPVVRLKTIISEQLFKAVCSHERLRVFSCSLFFHVLRCVKLV